jgi:hypothetical protein
LRLLAGHIPDLSTARFLEPMLLQRWAISEAVRRLCPQFSATAVLEGFRSSVPQHCFLRSIAAQTKKPTLKNLSYRIMIGFRVLCRTRDARARVVDAEPANGAPLGMVPRSVARLPARNA